ncbi:MAG: hypothetical protein ACREP9_03335, partial [Candidatus Dormibacteraceae bacterium]
MHLVRRTLLTPLFCVLVLLSTFAVASAHTSGTSSPVIPCKQPPPGIDWSQQSDAVLMSYGLPTHAMIGNDPKKWANFAHLGKHTCDSKPNKNNKHSHPSANTTSQPAWSGWWATNYTRGYFTEADSNFYVPTVKSCGGNTQTNASDWVGVGGVDTSPEVLVHAGVAVESDYNDITGQCDTTVTPWYEVAPNESQQDWRISGVNQNTYMYALISSNEGGDGYDYFFVGVVNGNYASTYDYSSSDLSDSEFGECILERNANQYGITKDLMDFSPDTFENCELTGGSNP